MADFQKLKKNSKLANILISNRYNPIEPGQKIFQQITQWSQQPSTLNKIWQENLDKSLQRKTMQEIAQKKRNNPALQKLNDEQIIEAYPEINYTKLSYKEKITAALKSGALTIAETGSKVFTPVKNLVGQKIAAMPMIGEKIASSLGVEKKEEKETGIFNSEGKFNSLAFEKKTLKEDFSDLGSALVISPAMNIFGSVSLAGSAGVFLAMGPVGAIPFVVVSFMGGKKMLESIAFEIPEKVFLSLYDIARYGINRGDNEEKINEIDIEIDDLIGNVQSDIGAGKLSVEEAEKLNQDAKTVVEFIKPIQNYTEERQNEIDKSNNLEDAKLESKNAMHAAQELLRQNKVDLSSLVSSSSSSSVVNSEGAVASSNMKTSGQKTWVDNLKSSSENGKNGGISPR